MLIQLCLFGILNLLSASIMISIITPYFLIAIFFLTLLYTYFIKIHLKTSREVNRILDDCRAPLIGIFS